MAGQSPETAPHRQRGGARWLTALLIVVALAGGLMIVAGTLLLRPDDDAPDEPRPGPNTPVTDPNPTATATPSEVAAIDEPTPDPTRPPQVVLPPLSWEQPTADPSAIDAALGAPVVPQAADAGLGYTVGRTIDPLTINPVRSRERIITYVVRAGDTLRSIAEQFGLQQSTIIWSNNRFYVNAMPVGLELTILPVDGVYHQVNEPQTLRTIAQQFSVDPYAIIDSEFNDLFGLAPDTVLPAGLYLVIPGGQGSTEPIYWDPGIEISGSNAGAEVGTTFASFGPGEPGSCGRQPVVGGSPPYSSPVTAPYSITKGFDWVHGGIDLAAPIGTDVFAAGGGTVIFAGWSTWGYGYTVVIAHGSTLTLYGHLNGFFVNCGQQVSAGQGIAVIGSSGQSSGPHLHFEIRGSNGRPVNPWSYQGF